MYGEVHSPLFRRQICFLIPPAILTSATQCVGNEAEECTANAPINLPTHYLGHGPFATQTLYSSGGAQFCNAFFFIFVDRRFALLVGWGATDVGGMCCEVIF